MISLFLCGSTLKTLVVFSLSKGLGRFLVLFEDCLSCKSEETHRSGAAWPFSSATSQAYTANPPACCAIGLLSIFSVFRGGPPFPIAGNILALAPCIAVAAHVCPWQRYTLRIPSQLLWRELCSSVQCKPSEGVKLAHGGAQEASTQASDAFRRAGQAALGRTAFWIPLQGMEGVGGSARPSETHGSCMLGQAGLLTFQGLRLRSTSAEKSVPSGSSGCLAQVTEDPDSAFLAAGFMEGFPLGVRGELPRVPRMFEEGGKQRVYNPESIWDDEEGVFRKN